MKNFLKGIEETVNVNRKKIMNNRAQRMVNANEMPVQMENFNVVLISKDCFLKLKINYPRYSKKKNPLDCISRFRYYTLI